MNKLSPILLGLSLAVAGGSLVTAQDQSTAAVSAPKYMQITVEYTKPGKGGMAHDKTESAFVQAATKVNFPIHYIAFNSLSGPARAIYMSHFDSFEAMQTANKVFEANAAEFERINVDDGELLESTKQLIFKYVPELSYHPHGPNPHAHYLEARILHVRSGHRKEFEDLVKMWMAVSDKAGSANHWGAYRVQYGDQVGTYVFLTSDNSMADIDNSFAEGPKFMAVLSEADRQVAGELRAEAIDADRFELYAVNPAQSYPPEEFVKADPDFWMPKTAAKPAMEEKKAKH
ncbi:MAG: hypothetical protein WCA89_01170 [Terracidiphilus sp.]|jgi:hypothetical protein